MTLESTLASYDMTATQRDTLDIIRAWADANGRRDFAPLDVPVHGNVCYHLLVKGWLSKADDWSEKRPRFVLVERRMTELDASPPPYRHVFSEVPRDLFQRIVGYDDVKRALRRTLIKHAPLHHWLVGPPASGKSVFLEEIRQRLNKARWIDGATTTPRGIATLLIDEDPDQLLIDEADHLSLEAQQTLHSVASQGMIRVTNAYMRVEQETAVQIIMTSNGMDVSPSFRSRFTMWKFTSYTRDEFATIGESIVRHAGGPRLMGTYIAKRIWDSGGRDIRQIEDIARICNSMNEVDIFLASPHLVLR